MDKPINIVINHKTKKASNSKNDNEIGGFKGQEPTTYGDWQHKGRVTDF